MNHLRSALLVVCGGMWLGGCAPAIDKSDGSGSTSSNTPSETSTPTVQITPINGQVIDPTLTGSSLHLQIAAPEGTECTLQVELWTSAGLAWPLSSHTLTNGQSATVEWDGMLGAVAAAPQRAEIAALVDCGVEGRGLSTMPVAVVRLAPETIDFDAGTGTVPLSFHKSDLATRTQVPIDGPAYARKSGGLVDTAIELPPWSHPAIPPWAAGAPPDTVDRNLPIAAVVGSPLTIETTPSAVDGLGAALVPEGVRVVLTSPIEGQWTGTVTGTIEPVAETAGTELRTLRWSWAACMDDGDGCTPTPVPGERQTLHRIYRMIGASGLRDGSAEGYASDRPFIATLALTAEAVEGAPDAGAVMTGLRDTLYTDPYVIYDPGVAAYSEFEGPYITWDAITSQLSAWLDRDAGLRLYCHSMSCLLSTLGNSWGADAQQLVLGVNFRTNQTRAAGDDDWLRWSFNSHSVATIDDGAQIWDASVDLDGDSDPANTPVSAVPVDGMPIDEYLYRLSGDDIGIVNDGKCWVE